MSRFYTTEGTGPLFYELMWGMVNARVHDALKKCAATCKRDIQKMQKMYLGETQGLITKYADKLKKDIPRNLETGEKEDIINSSLFLRYVCIENIVVLHEHISYPSQGGG